jgi:ABC-2 type transport system ATP-binding protein
MSRFMNNFNSLDTEKFLLINEMPEEKYSIEARVEVKSAKFSFGSTNILKDINLTLYAGEIYGLLGANGAGKTTLMKAISGRLQLDAGEIYVNSENPIFNQSLRSSVGYIPQDIAIFPYLTIRENLEIFGILSGVSKTSITHVVENFLIKASLQARSNQICRDLSGGYQRRVNICASILNSPPVIILDEPTVGIDVDAREAIHWLLRDLSDNGAAIMISTHDLDQAQSLCDRIGVLSNGVIAAEGAPKKLISDYFGNYKEIVFILESELSDIEIHSLLNIGLNATQSSMVWLGWSEQPNFDIVEKSQDIERAGIKIKEIRIHSPDLSSLFKNIMANTRQPS